MAETIETQVRIPDGAWEENGNDGMPWGRLYARLQINGVRFHLEAVAIEYLDDGVQNACDSSFESNLNGVAMASEPSGNWDTMEIRGREYVVFATPHC